MISQSTPLHDVAAARSTREQGRALVLVWLGGLTLFAGAVASSWSDQSYWMDAEEYAVGVTQGRWVVHPPGYLFFVALGRGLFACGFTDSHRALQVLTLLSTLAGMLALYHLLRTLLAPLQSSVLVFSFAFSWVPLLINHTGTSSTTDFFIVPFLLWSIVRVTLRPTRSAATTFALAVILCGGFRLTTLLMMVPLLLVVLWVNRRSAWVWAAFAGGGIAMLLLQLVTIHASGGWHLYSFMVWKQNFFRTYNLADDFSRPALFNVGRSLIWFALATMGLPFAFARLRSSPPWLPGQRMFLLYGALAMVGPFAICTFYLCEHPGYVAPALPGLYLAVAVVWTRVGGRIAFAKWPIAASVASLLLFFGMRYDRAPATRGKAIANYLLFQYSADGARHACYKTASEWLGSVEPTNRP